MKKEIFEYIKLNGEVTINNISTHFNMQGIECLTIVWELKKDELIKQTYIPLTMINDESCLYSVTGKEYSE